MVALFPLSTTFAGGAQGRLQKEHVWTMLILCSARLLAFESSITFNHFRMRSSEKARGDAPILQPPSIVLGKKTQWGLV